MGTLDGKKILIAAGGTGGHINPALAVAGYIRDNCENAEIVFVGTKNKMEATLVPQAGFELRNITISGFRRSFTPAAIFHNIRTLIYLFRSTGQAKKIIKDFKPDLVVGFGGYVSGPVLRVAAKTGVPTAIHEQNAFPGVTNKALAKDVDRVMLTVGDAEKYMQPKNKPVVTGLPIRGEILTASKEESRRALGLDERPLVLSMGGSLGAKPVNDAVFGMIKNKFQAKDCVFIHATGKGGTGFAQKLEEQGVDLKENDHITITEYVDVPKCLPAADLVICRAGASSLSEIQALGKPSILIPSPYVAENHQYHNAMALVNRNAAIILEEKNLSVQTLTDAVNDLLSDREKLEEIGRNAKDMAVTDASQRIYGVLCEIVK
ncbi:MAG: undecaprenyldiphospho-muramoylpentapeptide beta-N-acetylglucosaminyltransferase [Clostridia bacterium]|nr:undecaprenyldiphospho-muramoylpentapeptide beta-N-acetylglucosaminyltransferase [Clostridia bacterium]